MKIGFIGAPSTGKSTLAKKLAKTLKLPLVPEMARLYLELKPPCEPIDQRFIWLKQYELESQYPKGFVAEGCLANNLFYGELVNQFVKDLPMIEYTHIFWLIDRPKAEKDNVRVGLYLTDTFLRLFNEYFESYPNAIKIYGIEDRESKVLRVLTGMSQDEV